jgi:hypothetical protein
VTSVDVDDPTYVPHYSLDPDQDELFVDESIITEDKTLKTF